MTKQELVDLIQDMSLEEKVNQMLQVVSSFYSEETVITGPMKESGFTKENIAMAGSAIGALGAEKIKKMQSDFIKQQPHHIPLLFMLDVINGFRTVFPIPLGQGATFEPELSCRLAEVAAKEAAVSGVHVTFAPMVDLVRDARWGRVMEATGEDPYLNCCFSKAMVKGFQGEDIKEPYRVAACVKHFAGYGAPTGGRDYNTVELSEHTIREFYLPSYKAGIDAGAAMVMTSFNTIDGIPATGNKWLMKKILREEMGFEGVLISDWAAIEEMIYHGYCSDRKEAAIEAAEAGVDIDMMSGIYSEHLIHLVREQIIDEKLVDEMVYRILELKNKLGLFENPYKDADEQKEKELILCKEHRELAREAARKSFVLLKNDGVLPLKKEQKTAYIGPYVDNRNLLGAWSFIGQPEDVTTLKEAAIKWHEANNTVYCQGCAVLGNDIKLEGFTEQTEEEISKELEQKMLQEAIQAAAKSELVVMALGEHRLQSGEATSNANIQIPKVQMELFEKVCEVNENVVVILFSGRPLDIREISHKAKAVLEVWMPGTEGANAIMDVLSGEYNPSGKLPMSFPYCVGQVPVYYNEYSTGRPYVEGKNKDRFRSKYLDIPNNPLYPFGYGLSYTRFSVSLVKLSKDTMKPKEKIEASVMVKNEGAVFGTETVQLYIKDVAASVVRPLKELKNFKKISLNPGQSEEVCFTITEEDLQFLTQKGKWESEAGKFVVYIGTDSTTENSSSFILND
ncbi:beta-glucosidase BglX [Lachnotalea glycerini]|uniref:beta-glucosidase n=1 Tax=Lachnotalea glycerini TaxID=1763509 RepID=A0A371JAW9_9FIRM|nr:beta-glucosidase BglX [Lachnotalea glycerini]RDY29853.1 beta-glucosidase BglX [Lachnotalea glycerini]